MNVASDEGAPAQAPHPGRLLAVVSVAFLAMGMAQASIGPALPDLSRRTHSTTVAAGGALAALFAGAVVAQTAAGLLLQRLGRRRILIAGMCAFVLGTSGVAASPTLALLYAAAFLLGLGNGTLVLAGNVVAAEASRGAGPLNLVNAMFGVGSIASPALIGLAMTFLGTGVPVLWIIPCAMLVGFGLLTAWAPRPAEPSPPAARRERAGHRGWRSVFGSPVLWAICGFLFAYQSVEVVVTGWLPTILQRSAGLPLAMGALAASWFWFLITAVRFGAASVSRVLQPRAMLRVCVGLCVAGGALLVACAVTGSQAMGIAAATTLGLAAGPVFPTALAVVRSAFPREPGVATGLAMGVGSVGGAVMPWVLGALFVNTGPLAGAAVFLALPVAMALLLAFVDLRTRSTVAPTQP